MAIEKLEDNKENLECYKYLGLAVGVCRDMNIISNIPEYVKPRNVGLMFFSMEPDKFFPYVQLDVVRVHEGFLKEKPKGSRKGAKKKSRKKTENFRNFEREFYNDTDSAYGENEFNQKTSTKRHEGIAGGRCACTRRF